MAGSIACLCAAVQRQASGHPAQEVVGIRNSRHCRTMAEHVASLEWRTVKLAVEGNIGAGKSTFLDLMTDSALKMQDIIEASAFALFFIFLIFYLILLHLLSFLFCTVHVSCAAARAAAAML